MDVSDDDEDDDDDTAVDSPRAIKLSPLAAAAAQGQPATVQRLLASGAAIDAMDSLGETALCKAVFGHNEESRRIFSLKSPESPESLECVQLLLDAGADTSIVIRSGPRHGQTVLAAALKAKKTASATLIGAVSDARECQICAEDVTQETRVEMRARPVTAACAHGRAICFDCVRRHVQEEVNGKGNVEIRCPHNECGQQMLPQDVRHFSTDANFVRYDEVQTRRFLQSLPEFRWCAHAGCGSGQLTEGGEAVASFMRCFACTRTTCLRHRCEWHVGQTCEEYDAARRESEEVGLHQYLQSDRVRRCPNCQHGLEKAGGCEHFTCRKSAGGCGHEFCWLCLAPYRGPKGILTHGNHMHRPTCQLYAPPPQGED